MLLSNLTSSKINCNTSIWAHLGTPERVGRFFVFALLCFFVFPGWIIWGQKSHPKCGPHLLVAPHIKGHGRRMVLPAYPLAAQFLSPVPEILEPTSSGFQHRLKTSSNPPGRQHQTGTVEPSGLNSSQMRGLSDTRQQSIIFQITNHTEGPAQRELSSNPQHLCKKLGVATC